MTLNLKMKKMNINLNMDKRTQVFLIILVVCLTLVSITKKVVNYLSEQSSVRMKVHPITVEATLDEEGNSKVKILLAIAALLFVILAFLL